LIFLENIISLKKIELIFLNLPDPFAPVTICMGVGWNSMEKFL
jgi:hypothetical protein